MFEAFSEWFRLKAQPEHQNLPISSAQAGVILGTLLMLAVSWSGIFYYLSFREQAIRQEAHHDVRSLSIALEKHVERLLVNVDQVMRFIADDFADNPEKFDFQAWLRRSTSLNQIATEISFYDNAGELLGSRAPLAPHLPRFHVRDRAYFQALATQPNLGLYVDRTMRGRISSRYVIQTARRLSHRDGSFAGVIVTSVDPDYLTQQFEVIDVGRQGSIAMFGRDGFIRARFPQTEGMYEHNITTNDAGKGLFTHLREQSAGTYEIESAFDGVTRIFGYRAVGGYPLIVTVGKSIDAVMTPFRLEQRRTIAAGLLATVLVIAGVLRMLRRDREQQLRLVATDRALVERKAASQFAAEEARQANQLLALTAQMAHVGHWRFTVPSNALWWSEEVFRIFGLDPASGSPTLEAAIGAYHPDDRAVVIRCVSEATQQGREYDFSARLVRPDGSVREVICQGCCEVDSNDHVTALFGTILDVTQMRASEKAVRESEARFRSFADNSTAVLWIINAQTLRMEYLSPAYETVWGEARDHVLADIRHWAELIHPDDRAQATEAMPRSLAGERIALEYRIIRPCDGEVRWIRDTGFPIPAPDGGVLRVAGMALDITEERQAKTALAASEARYRLLADNTRDMIVQVDMDTTRRYVSPAARILLGYEPQELLGTKLLDMIHPDDQPVVRAVLADLSNGIRTSAIQRQRYRRKDGSYVWVEVSYQIFCDEAGQPQGCVACTRDITQRIEAEHRLRESEFRFRLLAENTSELIMLGHDDGRRSYISPASQRLLGFAPEELGTMRLRDCVHPEDLPHLYAATARSVSIGEVSCVHRALNKHRGWIWVEGVFRRIPEAAGNEPTIVATFRDVTEREAQAKALQQAKEIAETARAEAERASSAKTDFLATMSHEIRTPLNAIIGFTDVMVGSGKLDPDMRRQAKLVHTSGIALLTIVNDILDFSKVEAGAIELEAKPFAPRALIDNCASMVRGIATPKRLKVKTIIDDRLPAGLLGDEARLRQVLLNLLNNAIKFTHAGSVTLAVRCEGAGPDGERLSFNVTDTGIGIPRAKQAHLFQRFSQVDSSVQRTYGGTGLGLAICKQLIELMGGEIGVRSEEGQGSTFWFSITLPCAKLQAVIAPVTILPAPRKKGHLLLAEDVKFNQELAQVVLEAAGHQVEIVSDGAAAVQAVQTRNYDLVLMDVQMPGMDGITATQMIRRLPGTAGRIPIIAMTANVLLDELRKFREAGMDDHVGKPFNRAELYATIDRWLVAEAEIAALDACTEEPGFDRNVYRGVAELLTSQRLKAVLKILQQDIERSFADPVRRREDRERLRHEAHALTSASGMIGFVDLSAACRAMEACTEEQVQQVGSQVFLTLLATVRSLASAAASKTQALLDEQESIQATERSPIRAATQLRS